MNNVNNKFTRIEGSIKQIKIKPPKENKPKTEKAKKGATNGKRK